jgi:hypothetical protein
MKGQRQQALLAARLHLVADVEQGLVRRPGALELPDRPGLLHHVERPGPGGGDDLYRRGEA